MQKNKKGPLSHQKIKCSFLDYIQLLMISWVIRAKNVDQNAKKWKRPPKSLKNKMFIFGLLIQLLMISWAIWVKNVNQNAKKQKRPPKSSKNQMFVFGLCSTYDRPNDPSKKRQPKCKKTKGPLSHWKIKCSFLDYIQLLMISWVIQAKNIDRNAKKWKRPPKSLKNKMSVFGLRSTSDDWPSNLSKKMLT